MFRCTGPHLPCLTVNGGAGWQQRLQDNWIGWMESAAMRPSWLAAGPLDFCMCKVFMGLRGWQRTTDDMDAYGNTYLRYIAVRCQGVTVSPHALS